MIYRYSAWAEAMRIGYKETELLRQVLRLKAQRKRDVKAWKKRMTRTRKILRND